MARSSERHNGTMRPLDPRLLRHARSARKHIAVIALLGLLTAAFVIVQALLISASLSPVVTQNATLAQVMPIIWALVAVVLARAGLVALREALSHRGAEAAIKDLRRAVVDASVELGPRWRARNGADTATLLTRGLDDLRPYFVKFIPQLILTFTVTPLALGTILLLDFLSAAVALLTIPLIPVFMILIGRFTQESSAARLTAMQQLGSQLLDLMAGLPTLRGLGRQDSPREHLAHLGAQNTKVTMATLRIAFLSGGVLEFLATLSVALVAVEVGFRLVFGHIDLFTGLAVIMLAPEVFEPLRQVGAQFHASANGVAAANAAFEIIEDAESRSQARPASRTTPAPDLRTSTIRFDGLSVAARGTWAPCGLDAAVEPGTITALVGPSGAGKSTTVSTLLLQEPPTRGRILVGDVDLAEVEPTSWWRQVVWIPQRPTILAGTLRENLPAEACAEDLERAAKATGFDEVLAALPLGWDTRVGHGGVGLSVGQRQRLSLVKALVSQAPLVILDEPTAHLDAISEDTVVSTLRRLRAEKRTVLVIAHRLAVTAAADTLIEVHAQAASAEDMERWPVLATVETMEIADVDLPGFLESPNEATVEEGTR